MATADPVENPAAGGGVGAAGLPTAITYDDVAKQLLLSDVKAGGTVSSVVENTSNTLSAQTRFIVRSAGTNTIGPGITMEVTGGTSWELNNNVQLSRVELQRTGGFPAMTANTSNVTLCPNGDTTSRAFQFTHGSAFQGMLAGSILNGVLAGTEVMNIVGDYGGTAGRGVGIVMRDSTANLHKYGVLLYNRAGAPQLQLNPNGGDVILGSAAIATNATEGFFWLQSSAGPPTGVPSGGFTGRVPLHYDATNNKIYAYNGAWKATIALV